jgi:hypothetical protein
MNIGEEHEMSRLFLLIVCMIGICTGGAAAQNQPAPPDAQAHIIWPPDGQVVQGGKLWVRMGLKNMGVAPSGVSTPNTGHHHLLINVDPPPPGEPIPNDRNHLHFGAGETEARLTDLPPGEYTLQMLLGDANHHPHVPPVASEKITITVPPY